MTPAGRNYTIRLFVGGMFAYEIEQAMKDSGLFDDITFDSEGSCFYAYSVSYDRALFVANFIAQSLTPSPAVVVDEELVAFLRSVGCAVVSSSSEDGLTVEETFMGFEVRKATEALPSGYLSVMVETKEEAEALVIDAEVEDGNARWEMESERSAREAGLL